MVAGPTPTRTSPQGIASRVIAPQHIAGRRHRRGVAGGDVARGHDRDQRAAGGVDHPPGVGGARPAASRSGPSGRDPGRAAEPGPRGAVRGAVPGPRGRATSAPVQERCHGFGRRPRRRGRGRPATPGAAPAGRDPHALARAAAGPQALGRATRGEVRAPARPASAPASGPARARLAATFLAPERPQAPPRQAGPDTVPPSPRQAPNGGPRRPVEGRAALPRPAPPRAGYGPG
jgi:hypothetical protein